MLLKGQKVAQDILEGIAQAWKQQHDMRAIPHLAIVQVGNDPASTLYVQKKIKACFHIGFKATHHQLGQHTTSAALFSLLDRLNEDRDVHGILLQLPLSPSLPADALLSHIAPHKDVDGLSSVSMGRLCSRLPGFMPCTAAATLALLDYYKINVDGKHAVIVGASVVVGRPTALALLHRHATITICHAATSNLALHISQADILVVAIGNPSVIKLDWLRPDTVVIDIGINRTNTGRVIGDVPAEAASQVRALTPVPGGVGPVTVATLLANLYRAYREQVDA